MSVNQGDLFTLMGIIVEEKVEGKKPEVTSKKGASKTNSVSKSKTLTPSPATRASHVTNIRNMLVGLDYTISYSGNRYDVEAYARKLVDMENGEDLEEVRRALWNRIPEQIQKEAEEARRLKVNEAAPTDSSTENAPSDLPGNFEGNLSAVTPEGETKEFADSETNADDEASKIVDSDLNSTDDDNNDEDDMLDVDEESGEVIERKAVEVQGHAKPITPVEFPDGDLTIEMIRESLSIDYWEFDNQESVNWRVDRKNKRIYPSISAGKFGAVIGTKGFFWKRTDYENELTEKGSINIIAGMGGKLYEVRENPYLRVTVEEPFIRELEDMTEEAVLKMPRLPGEFLLQSLSFFNHYAEFGVECAVYVVCNRRTGEYELRCPEQEVGDMFVRASYPEDLDSDIVLHLHSHHKYAAKFSETDDANDTAFCIYGILGRLDQPTIEHRFRAGFNNRHVNLSIQEVFNMESSCHVKAEFPAAWIERVKVLR